MGRRPVKLTAERLYVEYFKRSHPRLAKEVVHWLPYGYMTLELWMENGSVCLYNGVSNRVTKTERRWKRCRASEEV